MRKAFNLTIALSLMALASFGRSNEKKEVLSLSKGKYVETFDQDSIEQIGDVLYNVNSRHIVGFITSKDSNAAVSLKPEVISRWLSIDPLAAKYPGLSPYNFAANNPILFKDIDGRDIYIYYKSGVDKNGNDINSAYKYGSKLAVPNNEFVQQSVAALNKLHESKAIAEKFDFINNSKSYHFDLKEGNSTEAHPQLNSYKNSKGVDVFSVYKDIDVNFNPTLGLQGKEDGKVLAPYGALWHELGHAYDAVKDPKEFNTRHGTKFNSTDPNFHFNDAEEKYDIQNNERPLAKENNMLIRNSHDLSDVQEVNTTSSTSSDVQPINK